MPTPNYNGQSKIHIQSYLGNIEKITDSLALGDGINDPVEKMGGHTPLFFACYRAGPKNAAAIEMIIGEGGNPLHRDNQGRLPLHIAANAGGAEAISSLLGKLPEKSALILDTLGRTPIHALCITDSEDKSYHDQIVQSARVLLDSLTPGEALNVLQQEDAQGNTPAMLAKIYEYDFLLEIFASYGLKLDEIPEIIPADHTTRDYCGRTTLHTHSFVNHDAEVAELLDSGADAQSQNSQMAGRTPFLYACAGISDATIVQIFLDKRPKENLLGPDTYGGTALHQAAYGKTQVLALLLTILPFAEQINNQDTDGMSALHAACMKPYGEKTMPGRVETMVLLLENGINPSLQNQFDETALDLAKRYGTEEALEQAMRMCAARVEAASTALPVINRTLVGSLGASVDNLDISAEEVNAPAADGISAGKPKAKI
ncbi:MAG: ankyrin repeat domain-containing protein [Francisellaceae bacterium]|jgi:ankyrin repeat protein|nr:ankyrin repeat domain-containing protein [Francisellaceae bacterium]